MTSAKPKKDPISMFLLGAAVLLGAMYLLENRARSLDEDAHTLAQHYVADLKLKCLTASAGANGTTLSLTKCPTSFALTDVDWSQVPSHFDTIAHSGPQTWTSCSRQAQKCETGSRKTKEKPTR